MAYFIGYDGIQIKLEDDEEFDFETKTVKKRNSITVVSPQGETHGSSEIIEPIESIKVKQYDCDVCGKIFNNHIALAGHKRSHK